MICDGCGVPIDKNSGFCTIGGKCFCSTECGVEETARPEEQKSVLLEAQELTSGDRNDAYGDYRVEAARIADLFYGATGLKIRPEHVPLMMICVKLTRERNKHKRDNLVDLAGYTRLLSQLYGEE